MKTNSLSAIEKLQRKRACLKVEEQNHLNKLNEQIDYFQDHWGSLLINSGIDAFKMAKAPLIQTIACQAIDILPMFLKGYKSMIATFILKNIKNFIFGKK